MPLLARLSSLWRNLFCRSRKDQELSDEIDAYMEMLVEQKVKEGLDSEEARRAALIEFRGREQDSMGYLPRSCVVRTGADGHTPTEQACAQTDARNL